jgi:6-phospho-beta-glucosidase
MIGRISILGGSSVYIPEFVLSIISSNLNVREIVLLGRPGAKLEIVGNFCQRLVNRSGFPTQIIATSDTATAVKDAQYILNHVRVGGMLARMRDEMLPPKYNIIGSDTLGAGAIANALRTLPVVFEHARVIEQVNPGAIYINLSNPIGILVEGLIKHTRLNVAGLCDLPGTYTRKVARLLGRNPLELEFDYVGLNNLGWIQDVKCQGRSKMSHLLELLEERPEEGFDYDLIQLFRMIPTRNTGLYFHRDAVLRRQQSGTRFRAEVLHEAEKQILKLYADPHLHEIPELTRQRNAVWYEETVLPVIRALESSKEQQVMLCVRNGQSIRDLNKDSSVEVPAMVGNHTFMPCKVGSLPHFLKGLFHAAKESDRLCVEAVLHRSYEAALQSLTVNPFVPSMEAAKGFLDQLIREEKLELN